MAVEMAPLDPPPRLSEIADPALLLDFDGTLVDLAPSPDAITVPDHLGKALERKAAALNGRLAIVSGRFIADIRGHLPDCAVVISGSHGAEIESPEGSSVSEREAPRVPDAALAAAREFAGRTKGLLLEEKALGLGLHYRDCTASKEEVRTFAQDLARDHGLTLRDGKMILELATTDADKGDGVRAIMAQPPFAGATPVFVGDDLTDEDGFAAVNELGGFAILVGEMRETAARYRLLDVAAVHKWLEIE
tara:strand:+ start:300 stop:1046 length:747 start_codon:yes stop_codon:yes gene_type:complete